MNGEPFESPRAIEILLVDDDPADVLLTKRALADGRLRNSLQVAKDGVEALQMMRREGEFHAALMPDLVLLDLNMPRMDGRELLQAIKADQRLCEIPVIVLTTSDVDQDVVRSFGLDASCYLTKPVTLKSLLAVVCGIKQFSITVTANQESEV